MKLLKVTILFILLACHGYSQNLNLPPVTANDRDVDISSSQIVGCTFLGMGIATIGYTAAKTHTNNYPALWYTGGSILATAGILILVFGDKEPPVKYWKGMKSHMYNGSGYNQKFIPNDSKFVLHEFKTNGYELAGH